MKMNLSEKRKEYISKQALLTRILIYLNIQKIWYEKRSIAYSSLRCEQMNKYNPLTWLFVIIYFICCVPYCVWKFSIEYVRGVNKSFKETKWG